MEAGFEALWLSMGLANFEWDQLLMIGVGGLLMYLAILKGFEPLLLLPIGFGCILANIPVAGLAADAIGHLLMEGTQAQLQMLATTLGSSVEELKYAVKHMTSEQAFAAKQVAEQQGFTPGMLNMFYQVAIGSGVAPLLIFMGVGALTDFSALIAMPRTLLLGAAAQFGIFFTFLKYRLLKD